MVSIGGIASAQAAATPPTSTTRTAGGYALSDNSATATEDGTTGSLAAAASASWDTLTFQGAGAGQTGTLSLTLSLATPASASTDVGTGGGCIAFGGSVCDPFTNTITGAGATETFTATVPLDTPLLVFDALYTVADNDFNIETTTIDPNLVLSLPAGVTFSTVSGNSGSKLLLVLLLFGAHDPGRAGAGYLGAFWRGGARARGADAAPKILPLAGRGRRSGRDGSRPRFESNSSTISLDVSRGGERGCPVRSCVGHRPIFGDATP